MNSYTNKNIDKNKHFPRFFISKECPKKWEETDLSQDFRIYNEIQ